MRALVYTRSSTVEVLDVEDVEVKDGEVIVEVEACGICGSELHGISQPGFRQPPLVMGHEFVGTTQDGRRVVVNPVVSCGSCDLCVADRQQLCRTRQIVGVHRAGAFAERVAVPARLLHDLPDSLTFEQGALIEPLANALHAWRLAGATGNQRIGVIGAGTIGLVCQLLAQHHGSPVAIADLSEQRLQVASRLGADSIGGSLDGEFDVVFDAVGVPATRRLAVDHLRPGGVTVWLGLMSADSGMDAQALIRQERVVRGSFAYSDQDFRDAVELAPKIDLSWSTSYRLDEGATIFEELMNGRADVVKALLRPSR